MDERGNKDNRNLVATLNFEGTSAAVYMIFFIRALDSASTGPANLTFYIDGIMRSTSSVRPEDYAFNLNNFTPSMEVFRASDIDPNIAHSLRIQWTHGGVTRPAVVVALDYIEFA
ncbi:hypothetical protein EST38_g3339 [Candolleomyces aberdarensis]|uniref:Uncharacterized protein n=1 Tax=Candolleomyces aberdarensis TaxID=2316362 RepID=A0A4Q2DTU2_9AGAR|nr:hypothetical protein EST38_g3339 [Candolleomyces aberdarensis]